MIAKRPYHISETVEIEETLTREFKSLQHIDSGDILRTICDRTKDYANAFLNGEGGTLYFGIEDNGVVTGVKLGRKERDDVQCRLGQIIKEFYPAVEPSLWKLEFVPILEADDAPVIDLYVIEVKIAKGPEDLYWPSAAGSVPYIRLPGGINRMNPSMIEQRVKRGRLSAAETEREAEAEDSVAVADTKSKVTNRLVDSIGREYVVVRQPSVIFTCQLPIVFGRGDYMIDAGGEIEIRTPEYRGVRVSLRSEDIRGSLMRGLLTPLSWHARPYLRQVDGEMYEVTIGDMTLQLRKREARHLCQCIDNAVSIYKEDLIQTEDVLQTWEYEIFERKDFIGVCLLQVPLELWRLMRNFSQEFTSSGDSEWHVFEPRQFSIQVGGGFSQHVALWALSPQIVYAWDTVDAADYVVLVHALNDFYVTIPYVKPGTSGREWIHSVGEAGIWTAEQSKHWLLRKFILKVLDHNKDRITGELRSALHNRVKDLRLSHAELSETEQLSDQVSGVQLWSHGSFNLVRKELTLPYYESLLTLAMQAKQVKFDYGYVSGCLEGAMHSLPERPAASLPCLTLDDILDHLRFHVDRMRRETTEMNVRVDYMSRVFLTILEAKPNLSQRILNGLRRGVEPIWREARFELRHMGS